MKIFCGQCPDLSKSALLALLTASVYGCCDISFENHLIGLGRYPWEVNDQAGIPGKSSCLFQFLQRWCPELSLRFLVQPLPVHASIFKNNRNSWNPCCHFDISLVPMSVVSGKENLECTVASDFQDEYFSCSPHQLSFRLESRALLWALCMEEATSQTLKLKDIFFLKIL